MGESKARVYFVDDDPSVGRALVRLAEAHGYRAAAFCSANAFLQARAGDDGAACVVLDLQMPDMDGITLQRCLAGAMPVIILTGHADVPSTVSAMQAGAIDFLLKPVADTVLLAAIGQACDAAVAAYLQRIEMERLRTRLGRLTPREREVMEWVVTGRLNKQVASELGTVEKTIKAHRASVMRKLEVASLPELVRFADKMGMSAAGPQRPGR